MDPVGTFEHLARVPDTSFWLGAASALFFVLGVLTLGRLCWGVSLCPQPVLPTIPGDDTLSESSSNWEPPLVDTGDRRRQLRRGGNTTPVLVIVPDSDEPQQGYVLDRSSGGLRLTVPQPLPIDTILQVRACHAPEGTPWAEAVVCWSLEASGRCELGCRFTQRPPRSVLLLFG